MSVEIEIERVTLRRLNVGETVGSFCPRTSPWKNGLCKVDIKIHVPVESLTSDRENELNLARTLIAAKRERESSRPENRVKGF